MNIILSLKVYAVYNQAINKSNDKPSPDEKIRVGRVHLGYKFPDRGHPILIRSNFCDVLRNYNLMAHSFKKGDHVIWNSEAGHVSGKIIKIHTADFDYKGYTHHATQEDPQYEIKSDKSDHIAAHKGSALSLKK